MLQGNVFRGKGKGWVLAIVLLTWVRLVTRSAFTISEVAADWQEPTTSYRNNNNNNNNNNNKRISLNVT